MRINEIVASATLTEAAPGSFGAQAGVFGRALGQAATQAMLPGANTGGAAATRTGDARAAADEISEPVLRQQAAALTKTWNDMVTDQMKKAGISSPLQLSTEQQRVMSDNLMNMINQTLLQQRFGGDFRSIPKWVDQPNQPKAQQMVTDIKRAAGQILNIRAQPQNLKQQQEQWYDLAKLTNQASRLAAFNPYQYGSTQQSTQPGQKITQPPRITVDPQGRYQIGKVQLDPRDPMDAAVIAKIQAASQP
jgi:hypothetical protein